MVDTVFRQYDIRGIVGSELDIAQVRQFGKALAYYFLHQNKISVKTVAVGMDGRNDSPAIKKELIEGLRESGLNVIFVGLCPTPVLYFALHTLPVEAGIMITASHNGKDYNGFKICLSKESVWGRQIEEIKQLFKDKKQSLSLFKGNYKEYNLVDKYINWLANQFKNLRNFSMPVIVDCLNGASGVVMSRLFETLNFQKATIINDNLDGNFPNGDPDPVNIKNVLGLQKLVRENKSIAIAFDGDADRMVPFDSDGNRIEGDKMVALYAKEIIQNRPSPVSVVFDIKCSAVLPRLLTIWGARPHIVPSGHSIIKHEMKKNQALLAGELSCHFFFSDKYFGYDDGIYACLRLLELMHEKKNYDLQNLLSFFPKVINTPEIRISCAQKLGEDLVDNTYKFFSSVSDAQVCTIDGVKAILPYGWGLIRFSNTQPVLTLRFESSTLEGLEKIKQDFCYLLKDKIDVSQLQDSTGVS